MSADNQVSAVLTDENVTAILGHIEAIRALLPFLISRPDGDTSVMLGEKTVGFDQKCATYQASNPEFLPSYVSSAEVLKDRSLRGQMVKFQPQLGLLAKETLDTFNVVGNELMMADLAYYNTTAEAAKRGIANAADIHDDLATRYPGRGPAKKTPPPA